MNPIHMIAEVGTNHNGSEQTARQLIDVAVDAGADSVKFQIIYPEGLYVEKIKDANGAFQDNDVIRLRRKSMLSDEAYQELAAYAAARRIPLSASVFDQRGIDLLCAFDPPYIKIASCDLNNIPLLTAAAETGRTLLVSTGMATLDEVEASVQAIDATGNRNLVLMHCVSVYPCPTRQMNLNFLVTLKSEFGFPIGLSDHTEDSVAAAASVALGVSWIEKHFTLDRSSEGFDHAYAMEPPMLARYIQDVRDVWAAMQPFEEKVGPQESRVRVRARRALYAARDIQPGERIGAEDVLIVRPTGPLAPGQLRLVVGQRSARYIPKFEPLRLEQLDRAS